MRLESLSQDQGLLASTSVNFSTVATESLEMERRLNQLEERLEQLEERLDATDAECNRKLDRVEDDIADEILRTNNEFKSLRARITVVEDAKQIDSTLRVEFMNGFDADRRALFDRADKLDRKMEASLSAHRSLYASESNSWRAEVAALSHRLERLERAAP